MSLPLAYKSFPIKKLKCSVLNIISYGNFCGAIQKLDVDMAENNQI